MSCTMVSSHNGRFAVFLQVMVKVCWPMVSALTSGSSAPGSSPGRGHCVLFLGKTLNSNSASLHPGV